MLVTLMLGLKSKQCSTLSDYLGGMEGFMQTCPCHSSAAKEEMPSSVHCPLSGFRAICLASGALDEHVHGAAAASTNMLLRDLFPRASWNARTQAILNFNHTKSMVVASIVIRATEHKDLPNLFFKVGNQDDEVAMVGMADCILLFDFASPAHQAAMQLKMRQMWAPGSAFRDG